MESFSTSKSKRDFKEQSSFRESLIKAYDNRNEEEFLWDPILKTYVTKNDAIAAHLFAYRHGQATMNAIFGLTNPSEFFHFSTA